LISKLSDLINCKKKKKKTSENTGFSMFVYPSFNDKKYN